MFSKRIASLLVVLLTGVLFVALVGARGSIGFTKGSVKATGEISGKFDNDGGFVKLTVNKHPNASGLELYATCQNNGGNIAQGVNPAIVNMSLGDIVSTDQLYRTKGAVHVGAGDLEAYVENLNQIFNATDTCPNENWDVIEAYPVGFEAVVEVLDANYQAVQRMKYVCGTTLAAGGSPFVSGNTYNCVETEDTVVK